MYTNPLSNAVKASILLAVFSLVLVLVYCVALKCYSPQWDIFSSEESVPRNLQKYLMFEEGYTVPRTALSTEELNTLNLTVQMTNKKRQVFNVNLFGAVSRNTTMLVVRVNRDAERLQYLIASLSQVRDIQRALVIFSHSFYDESINELIKRITFCRYMQIYYPFSIQLSPNKFPGVDPTDYLHVSPRRVGKNNKRKAYLTERKHHWWWQAHFVFTHLAWSPTYTGTVIFLEEDDYVLPDLLHVLCFAKRAQAVIPELNVIVFGKPFMHKLDYDKLKVDVWKPTYQRGLAFNKTIWEKIYALSSYYCTYDDINWSQSLFNLFTKFPEGHTDMVASTVPRVVSTGLHASGKQALKDIFYIVKSSPLFPKKVKAGIMYNSFGRVKTEYTPPLKKSGGWSDPRDHLLCMNAYSLNQSIPAKTLPDNPDLYNLTRSALPVPEDNLVR